jgi:hypothetical protein
METSQSVERQHLLVCSIHQLWNPPFFCWRKDFPLWFSYYSWPKRSTMAKDAPGFWRRFSNQPCVTWWLGQVLPDVCLAIPWGSRTALLWVCLSFEATGWIQAGEQEKFANMWKGTAFVMLYFLPAEPQSQAIWPAGLTPSDLPPILKISQISSIHR